MRILLISSLFAVFVSLAGSVLGQHRQLLRANESIARGNPRAAREHLDSLLNASLPLFADRARAACSRASIEEAKLLSSGPREDPGGAARLLAATEARCGYEPPEAKVYAAHFGRIHLSRASDRCARGEHQPGLNDLLEIQANDTYPADIHRGAALAAASCRAGLARDHERAGRFDEAADELLAMADTGNEPVKRYVERNISRVVQRAVTALVGDGRPAEAFEVLRRRRSAIDDESWAASELDRFERELERRVFGRSRSGSCSPLASADIRFVVAAPSVMAGSTDSAAAALYVQNATSRPLRILLRGPQSSEIRVETHGHGTLRLEPGRYAVAVVPAKGCIWSVEKVAWKLDESAQYDVTVSESRR